MDSIRMNATYAEISRVGNFEADFRQVPLVHFFFFFFFFFWNFHNIVYETSVIQIQQRKGKKKS